MFCIMIKWAASLIFLFTLPGGWGKIQQLKGKCGQKIELRIDSFPNLEGVSHILWSVTLKGQPKDLTLIEIDNGTKDRDFPGSFRGRAHLNTTSGTLTIGPLSKDHSGVYRLDITDANNLVHNYRFNVTVVLFTLPGGWGKIQQLKGKCGQKIELRIDSFPNLEGVSHILWSVTLKGQPKDLTLIEIDNGTKDRDFPGSFRGRAHLNTTSGTLTIGPLSKDHSGMYRLDITDANNLVHNYRFNVTVELGTDPLTAGPGKENTEHQRNHIAAVVLVSLFAAGVFMLLGFVCCESMQRNRLGESKHSGCVDLMTSATLHLQTDQDRR